MRWSGSGAHVLLRIGWVALVALAPGPSRGQEPPADAPAQQPGAEPAPQPGGWQLSLRADESWDSNPRLLPETSSGSFVHQLDLSLGYERVTPRSSISLGGAGGGSTYETTGSNSRFVYSFTGDTWLQASPSTRLTLNHAMGVNNSQEVPFLVEEGLPIQRTRSRSATTTAGLTSQLGSRGNLELTARRVAIAFDDPQLVDGSVLSAEIRGERRTGPEDSFTGGYIWQRSDRADETRNTHSLLVGWRGRLGEHTRGVVELGVVAFDGPEDGVGLRAAPRGELSLDRQLAAGTLTFRYARLVTQDFGTGRDRLADLVSLGFARTIGASLTLNASLGYTYSKDPADPAFRFHTQVHRLSAAYRISRGVTLETGYSFFSRKPETTPASSRHLVNLLFVSDWNWR